MDGHQRRNPQSKPPFALTTWEAPRHAAPIAAYIGIGHARG
jgi:hypothetical protein